MKPRATGIVLATCIALGLGVGATMVVIGLIQGPPNDLYDATTGALDVGAILQVFAMWSLPTFLFGGALCFGAGAIAKARGTRRVGRARSASGDRGE